MTEFLQQLVNGITLGLGYALIALGYTMVYGILRLINFAHGDVYMLGAFFGFYAARLTGAAVSQSDSIHRRDPYCSFVVQRPTDT